MGGKSRRATAASPKTSSVAESPESVPMRAAGASVHYDPAEPVGKNEPLTVGESDVLHFMARGLTNEEIAARLNNAKRTVEKHISRILSKLEVPHRNAAIAVYRDWEEGRLRRQVATLQEQVATLTAQVAAPTAQNAALRRQLRKGD